MDYPVGDTPGSVDGVVTALMENEGWLWAVAVLLYVVGDGITTLIGLENGMVEQSVVAAQSIDAVGFISAFIILKTLTLVVSAVLWHFVDHPYRLGVPLGLGVVGGVVTVGNAVLLVQAA